MQLMQWKKKNARAAADGGAGAPPPGVAAASGKGKGKGKEAVAEPKGKGAPAPKGKGAAAAAPAPTDNEPVAPAAAAAVPKGKGGDAPAAAPKGKGVAAAAASKGETTGGGPEKGKVKGKTTPPPKPGASKPPVPGAPKPPVPGAPAAAGPAKGKGTPAPAKGAKGKGGPALATESGKGKGIGKGEATAPAAPATGEELEPPPGMTKMQLMQWKKKNARAAADGGPAASKGGKGRDASLTAAVPPPTAPEPAPRHGPRAGPAAALYAELFEAIDSDGSGFLDEAEGKQFLRCSGCEESELDYYWADLVRTADTDRDGRVGKAEFLTHTVGNEDLDASGDFVDRQHEAVLRGELLALRSAVVEPAGAKGAPKGKRKEAAAVAAPPPTMGGKPKPVMGGPPPPSSASSALRLEAAEATPDIPPPERWSALPQGGSPLAAGRSSSQQDLAAEFSSPVLSSLDLETLKARPKATLSPQAYDDLLHKVRKATRDQLHASSSNPQAAAAGSSSWAADRAADTVAAHDQAAASAHSWLQHQLYGVAAGGPGTGRNASPRAAGQISGGLGLSSLLRSTDSADTLLLSSLHHGDHSNSNRLMPGSGSPQAKGLRAVPRGPPSSPRTAARRQAPAPTPAGAVASASAGAALLGTMMDWALPSSRGHLGGRVGRNNVGLATRRPDIFSSSGGSAVKMARAARDSDRTKHLANRSATALRPADSGYASALSPTSSLRSKPPIRQTSSSGTLGGTLGAGAVGSPRSSLFGSGLAGSRRAVGAVGARPSPPPRSPYSSVRPSPTTGGGGSASTLFW